MSPLFVDAAISAFMDFTADSGKPFEDGKCGALRTWFTPQFVMNLFMASEANWSSPSDRNLLGMPERTKCLRIAVISISELGHLWNLDTSIHPEKQSTYAR